MKILFTYRGGYGDVFSIFGVLNRYIAEGGHKITVLCEKPHLFLADSFPGTNWIENDYQPYLDFERSNKHFALKKRPGLKVHLLNKSTVRHCFGYLRRESEYMDFYRKLIREHDLVVTQYLDVACTSALAHQNGTEWHQVRAWHVFEPETDTDLGLLNIRSPHCNYYYYPAAVLKGFTPDPLGEYQGFPTDPFSELHDPLNVGFILGTLRKEKRPKVFVSMGSMFEGHALFHGKYAGLLRDLAALGYLIIVPQMYRDVINAISETNNFAYYIPDWFPHDELIALSDFVIHHGGCGVTNRVLRQGKRSLVIAHQLDQFYWGTVLENWDMGRMTPAGELDDYEIAGDIDYLTANSSAAAEARKIYE